MNSAKNTNELLDVIFKIEIETAIVIANPERKEGMQFIGNKRWEINNKEPLGAR